MKTGFAIGAMLLAAPAWALNMNFFQDAPITRLNAEEVRAFRAFVMKTLEEVPDGTMVEWKATKTTFTSKVTPQKTYLDAGVKCREATIDSDSHDRQMRGLYRFCRQGNNDWEFRNPTPAKAAKPQ